MYIKQIFELSMVLDNEKFQKVLDRSYKNAEYLAEDEEYIDQHLSSKGITVVYRDSQYKKKVKLIVEPGLIVEDSVPDSDRLLRKLDKRIGEYFNFKYKLNDFGLSGMTLAADIDVHSRANVSAYLKVLHRIGKVKGFSPVHYDCFEEVENFCLEGNSNGVEFWLYDLEGLMKRQFRSAVIRRKKMKSMVRETEGILRAEVRLTKPRAVRNYTAAAGAADQIAGLAEKGQEIFLDVFTRIIPFGDYYKKDKAVEIVRKNVGDSTLRRKMLRLLTLIPEKKSLYLAQKAMNCRDMEKVMEGFAEINVSPVTISKRQDGKYMKNVYKYLLDK